MPSQLQAIEAFIAGYAVATSSGDAEAIAASHAPTYIESAPSTCEAFAVDGAYRYGLREKSAAMQKLGLTGATARVLDATSIAPLHALARTEWTLAFQPPGKPAVRATFEISYVLRMPANDAIQILLAISHEDEEQAMKDLGLG